MSDRIGQDARLTPSRRFKVIFAVMIALLMVAVGIGTWYVAWIYDGRPSLYPEHGFPGLNWKLALIGIVVVGGCAALTVLNIRRLWRTVVEVRRAVVEQRHRNYHRN